MFFQKYKINYLNTGVLSHRETYNNKKHSTVTTSCVVSKHQIRMRHSKSLEHACMQVILITITILSFLKAAVLQMLKK